MLWRAETTRWVNAVKICLYPSMLITQWAYKIPFALQWVWPLPLMAMISFAPESPWWLVRAGRLEDAEDVVERLGGNHSRASPKDTVATMVRTNAIEMAETAGTTYADCFKGTDLRRTWITCFIHSFANFTGLLLSNLGTYFFTVAGLPSKQAFALGLGTTGIQFVAVLGSWWLSTRAGRRSMYLGGLAFNIVVLGLIGTLACLKQTTPILWAQGVLLILISFQWGFTMGPITYTTIGETSSVRLRAKTVGLSRDAYYLSYIPLSISELRTPECPETS